MDIYQEQFGFDAKTAGILCQIYRNMQEKYSDLSETEKAGYFARAMSQMGGYNNKSAQIFGLTIETDAWKKGDGIVYEYEQEKKYFCEEIGIKEGDYNYIRYMIRLQHFITSTSEHYSYDEAERIKKEDIDEFREWKSNMEKALGKALSDEEYLDNYKEIYMRVNAAGDCSHMLYTIAANLIDEEKGVDNSWNNWGHQNFHGSQ